MRFITKGPCRSSHPSATRSSGSPLFRSERVGSSACCLRYLVGASAPGSCAQGRAVPTGSVVVCVCVGLCPTLPYIPKISRICASMSVKQHLVFLHSVRRLLVTANVVPSSPILTLMKEALRSSETSVLTRATRRNIPEDTILQNLLVHRAHELYTPNFILVLQYLELLDLRFSRR
jgi:hypothetical protein